MEQYPNLPGFSVDLRDDGLQVSRAVINTDSLLLFGTALKGPWLTPVNIGSLEEADAIFGAYHTAGVWNGKTLPVGLRQAYGAGCRNFTLVRLPDGTQSSINFTNGTDPKLVAKSYDVFGTSANSSIKVAVTTHDTKKWIQIWNLEAVAAGATDPTKEYKLTDYATFADLIAAINADSATHNIVVELPTGGTPPTGATSVTEALFTVPATATALSGATAYSAGDYSTEASMRGQLGKAMSYMSDYDADLVVALGFEVDASGASPDTTDADKLADFCYNASLRNSRMTGVMAVKALAATDVASVAALVTKLTDSGFTNLYTLSGGEDAGKHLSIVVGEQLFYDVNLGAYSDTSDAAYAGMIASLSAHSATTNKVLQNSKGLRYGFYPTQLDSLTAKRLVTFRLKNNRGVTVTDGITCAKVGSDFKRLSTFRIANAAIKVVRSVAEPFIGEALDSNKMDAITTAIESGLTSLQEAGAITAKAFRIYFENQQDMIDGILTVELSIVPAFEVGKIRLKMTLKPTL